MDTTKQNELPFKTKKAGQKWTFGCIPVRYVLTFLLATGTCISITMRVNINVAIVAMVRYTPAEPSNSSWTANNTNDDWDSCPTSNSTQIYADNESQADLFEWSPSIQGVILAGFFYGYICTQVLGGRLSERVGPRLVFAGGILGSSVMNLLTPLAAGYGYGPILAARIISGACQGFMIVAMYNFIGSWYPSSERGLHLSLALIGLLAGNVVTMPAVGYLCQYGFAGGWPSAFYLFGSIGLVFTVPFVLLTRNRPEDHPFITDEELHFIQAGVGKVKQPPPIPWSKLLRSTPIWILGILRFSSGLAFHIVQSKVPAYLDAVLQYPIQENGLINSIFYISKSATGIISGHASDVLIRRKILSVNSTRKIFQTLTSLGAAACLLAVPLVRCDSVAVTVLLAVGMGIHGLQNGGEMPVAADLAPIYSGTIFGLTNSFASAAGILAPSIAGAFLDGNDRSLTSWSYVYYLIAGICTLGCLLFLFLGSAERLPWGQGQTGDEDLTTTTTSDPASSRNSLQEEVERY